MANKITTLFEDETKTNILFPRTKRLAISDENNNPLTEVGFYTADTILSGVESIIPGGVTADLLWTNSAPTSSFAAQTISLDLTDYGIIIVVFKAAATWAQLANAVVTEKDSKNHRIEMLVNSDLRVRDFTVSNTGIAFGKNQNFRTSTLAYSDDNSCLLPYKIYGIKSANTVSGQEKIEAIWTNPSPTSSFSSTTITPTDFGNYARGAVLFGYDTSNSPQCLVYFTKGGTFICNIFNSNTSRVFRTFTVSDSTIAFGGGTSAGGDNNGAAIPLVVYGIR